MILYKIKKNNIKCFPEFISHMCNKESKDVTKYFLKSILMSHPWQEQSIRKIRIISPRFEIRIGIRFGQNGAYRRRLVRVRNRIVGVRRCLARHGAAFQCVPYSRTCTQQRFTRRGSHVDTRARGEALSASWLTCRFIDEFGRTFVRQDFNTIEESCHCCPRGETSSRCPSDMSVGKNLVLDAVFDIIMTLYLSRSGLDPDFLRLKEFMLRILLCLEKFAKS